VPKRNQHAAEINELHEKAAQVRLQSVETQLSLVLTLCASAETEILLGHPEVAHRLARKIRHHSEAISFHLDEPGHLPDIDVSDLRKQLTEVEKRTDKINARVKI